MSIGQAITFIHKDGRVIPIRAATGAVRATALATSGASVAKNIKQHKNNESQANTKVNRGLDAFGLGLSVASGAIAAATFSKGTKGLVGGAIASHALDAAGVAANIGSVAKGPGTKGEKAKQAARQEARNFLVGNAVYAAGLIGLKSNRQAFASYSKSAVVHAQKLLAFSRKALRVI